MKRPIVLALFLFLFLLNGCEWKVEVAQNHTTFDYSKLSAEHIKQLNKVDLNIQKDKDAYSFLYFKDQQLILESYYNGIKRSDENNIKSMTKVVMTTLIGIAIEEGHIESVDQAITDFFPEYPFQDEKQEITIKHLLTMTDGLSIEENSPEMMELFESSPNWIEDILHLPLAHTPGEKYNYSSASTHLLSAIITKSTGMNAMEYGNLKLFGPLGFTVTQWNEDPQGNNMGGSQLYLTPLQLLKIGQLYLNVGKWDGQSIVSEEWIMEATSRQSDGQNRGLNSASYGYGWWILNTMDDYAETNIYVATGYGEQYMIIDPDTGSMLILTRNSDVQPEQLVSHFDEVMELVRFEGN